MTRSAPAPNARRMGLAFACGALVGFAALAMMALWHGSQPRAQQAGVPPIGMRVDFARPTFVPNPEDNPPTTAKVALGQRLFEDEELSSTGAIACASCHDPKLAFADGEPKGRGVTGKRLTRHTPTLWNVAWSPLLFWDGRAENLENQVHVPIEHPDEMGATLENGALRLSRHESYVRAFAEAFPQDPVISPRNMAKAIAAYERTLISPPTRFDRWVAGDNAALSPSELSGFAIFTGKGGCTSCHSGFAFTDHGFYDIGLAGQDKGRGPIAGLDAADHAFKTPTLRELAWTAPYMHDGSLATLEDVVRHYENGGVRRPTRSRELPNKLILTDKERADLVAFLESLSSDEPPKPSTEPWVGVTHRQKAPPAQSTTTVSQANKLFNPARVRLKRGESLTVLNDDTRTHNVRIYHQQLDFNSGAQEPHEAVTIRFPVAGTFEAFCGIHPAMRLTIEVE